MTLLQALAALAAAFTVATILLLLVFRDYHRNRRQLLRFYADYDQRERL